MTRILERKSAAFAAAGSLSSSQAQMDGLLESFAQGASDWRSLAAMSAGSLAYRAAKLGLLSLGAGRIAPLALRLAAPALALGTEVSVYRGVTGALGASAAGSEAGISSREFLNDYVHFASLKLFGVAARGQGFLLSHALQDAGMLAGHQLAHGLGLIAQPQGSLMQQWVRAELANLQMQAGFALAGALSSHRLASLEKGFEVRIQARESIAPRLGDLRSALFVASETTGGVSASLPSRASQRPPQLFFEQADGLIAQLRSHVAGLPEGVKLLEVELRYDDYPSKREAERGKVFGFTVELAPELRREAAGILEASALQEIRLHYPNGCFEVLFKHERFAGKATELSIEQMSFTQDEAWEAPDFEAQESAALDLIGPWEMPKLPKKGPVRLSSELARLRHKEGFTQAQAAEKLRDMLGSDHTEAVISRHENDCDKRMPLATLSALARIYRSDVRKLIALSNLAFYPQVDPAEWATREYPLYIEGDYDLERFAYYRVEDPAHETFGFRAFAARKNPWHPLSMTEAVARMGLVTNALLRLETHGSYPTVATLEAMASVLALDGNELLLRLNDTFHADLPLRRMFGDRGVYIPPTSNEREQILRYAEEPGSLGEEMYVFRRSQPGHLSAEAMSRQIKRHDGFWRDREWNRVPLEIGKMREWIATFAEAGMPLDGLMRRFAALGVQREHPGYLLASAMGRMNRQGLHEISGIDLKLLTSILAAEGAEDLRKIQPETILDLKRALPDFRADLFHRLIYPDVVRFFPEAAGDAPRLRLSRGEIAEAAALNLGHRLYAHRMEQGIGLDQMGKALGVSDSAVKQYEALCCQIESPEVLMRLAGALGIEPRILYLHFHPQVLRLYALEDAQGGKLEFGDAELTRWNAEREKARDAGNMRRKLVGALRGRGILSLEAFAAFMGMPAKKAEKYWHGIRSLVPEEIRLLCDRLPELDYRKWFEHFYGPQLEYFLGRLPDSAYDYRLPGGHSWESLAALDLEALLRQAMARHYPSPKAAAAEIGVGFLGDNANLKRSIAGRAWPNDNIARIARGLRVDRRLLYFYFRQAELREVLGLRENP